MPKPLFKPGQSGNPSGRPPAPADIKEVRNLNKFEVERIISKVLHCTQAELKLILEDEETPALELAVCRVLVMAIKEGDYRRLELLLARAVGPVQRDIVLSGSLGLGFDEYIHMTPEQRKARIEEIQARKRDLERVQAAAVVSAVPEAADVAR